MTDGPDAGPERAPGGRSGRGAATVRQQVADVMRALTMVTHHVPTDGPARGGGPPARPWARRAIVGSAVAAVVGVALARLLGPRLLAHHERFPALATAPTLTRTARGVAADPVNLAVVGAAPEIVAAFRAAGWAAADSLSRASDLAIARSVLLNRPDSAAPVSSLFLFGRRQDLAFEQQVGPSARRRHHVRLWRDGGLAYAGRDVWLAAATFDARAGISHRTLRPTHHIAPDVDAERDAVEGALAAAGRVLATFRVTGVGLRVDARNAEGDRYDTDGELRVVVLAVDGARHDAPADPGVPAPVALAGRLWRWAHRASADRSAAPPAAPSPATR